MRKMNTIAKQIEDLINSNVPKNIDLRIPVSKDNELQEMLKQILEKVNENNLRLKNIEKRQFLLSVEIEKVGKKDYYDFYNYEK